MVNMDHSVDFKGETYQDFDCLLSFVDDKSDKFYRIQVLRNDTEFYVRSRWGRNVTDGRSKIDGPLSQKGAEENFRKKFQEKTENIWDKRQQFSPVKGKYILVQKTDCFQISQNQELASSNTCSEEVKLPADVLHAILSQLSLRDVLRCMQVCKAWKTLLSEKKFLKMYAQKRFDLGIKSDLSNEGPMARWSGPEHTQPEALNREDVWYCEFNGEGKYDDVYVMRPFPSMWNSRVVHPFGLDPFSGDVKSLQGFCRSLEILKYMRNEASRLDMQFGNECSSPDGQDEICVVLFPWNKRELPTPLELLNGVFHFHPEIYECYESNPQDGSNVREGKLYFHVNEESEDDHDLVDKPCLNSIFGMRSPRENEQWTFEDCRKFYEWLQPIMCPTVIISTFGFKLSPDAIFMLTQLAPGWVGGALTAGVFT